MSNPAVSIRTVKCHDCRMSALCLPLTLERADLDRLDSMIQRGRPLQKNQHLFYAGDEFHSVYAVRSGAIKSYCVSNDGQEQVTGFYLPGEIFGWDGIAESRHSNTTVALETSAICELPFERLEELSADVPALQRHFMQLMSKEITTEQQLISLLSKNTAEERIASLLLSLSNRLRRQKLSPTRFRLPMSRADMGNYLGLTVETVSRTFSRLQKEGIIAVDKKELAILDLATLTRITLGSNRN